MDLGVDGMQHQGEGGVANGDFERPTGDSMASCIRMHQYADSGAEVPGLEIVQVHRPDHFSGFLDDPPQLAGRIDILMAEADGFQDSPGEWGHGAGHGPVLGVVLPLHDLVDIGRLKCAEPRRAIVEQIGWECHGRSKILGQSRFSHVSASRACG